MASSQETVSFKDLCADAADKLEVSKKQMNEIIDEVLVSLTKALKKGNRVRVSGIGTFRVTKRAARMGMNPATKKMQQFKASKNVGFKASKDLREAVNK